MGSFIDEDEAKRRMKPPHPEDERAPEYYQIWNWAVYIMYKLIKFFRRKFKKDGCEDKG